MTFTTYSIRQVAEMFGQSEATIKREIADGHLRAMQIRSRLVILESDLMLWVERCQENASRKHVVRPVKDTAPTMPSASAGGSRFTSPAVVAERNILLQRLQRATTTKRKNS